MINKKKKSVNRDPASRKAEAGTQPSPRVRGGTWEPGEKSQTGSMPGLPGSWENTLGEVSLGKPYLNSSTFQILRK